MLAKLYTILQYFHFSESSVKLSCNHFTLKSRYIIFFYIYIISKTETNCELKRIFSNHNWFVLPVIYHNLINLVYFVRLGRVFYSRGFTNVFMLGISSYRRNSCPCPCYISVFIYLFIYLFFCSLEPKRFLCCELHDMGVKAEGIALAQG